MVVPFGMSAMVCCAWSGVGSGREARVMPLLFAAMAIQPRGVGKIVEDVGGMGLSQVDCGFYSMVKWGFQAISHR